jgi:formylglycine-generating enzyme required for sulfatase activity
MRLTQPAPDRLRCGYACGFSLQSSLFAGRSDRYNRRRVSHTVGRQTKSLLLKMEVIMKRRNIVIIISSIAVLLTIILICWLVNQKPNKMVSKLDGMTMIYIPAGEFTMGYPEAEIAHVTNSNFQFINHKVYLDGYWMDMTEVTNDMFDKFTAETQYVTDAEKRGNGYVALPTVYWQRVEGASWKHPLGPDSNLGDLGNHPVVQVSWNDAKAYCDWAGRRLPTDAEWEKAARGTDSRFYPWGNNEPNGELANLPDLKFKEYIKNNFIKPNYDDGYIFTSPVGYYPKGKSPYEILDMSGNVWEWVSDFASEEYVNNPETNNPKGPASGAAHIIRGASWDVEYGATSVHREMNWTNESSASLGIRCAYSKA